MLDEPTVAGSPPQVVDGKRRILACEAAGVQPTYRLLRGDVDPKVYLWARNGERRNLTPSQKAFYFAELFPSSGPGRPPSRGENCPMSDNFPQPTQGQGAKEMGISRHLVHGASKIVAAIKNGRLVPEAGEAIKKDIATVSDVVKDNVMDAPMEVQLEALSLVKGGTVRTMAAAVERVKQETLERMDELGSMSSLPLKNPSFPPPLRIGKRAAFHQCSVDELKARVKPGSVNLILVHPPDGAPIEFFLEIGALASHALKENGVLVAAVVATGNLPERLTSLLAEGPGFIAEFNLQFPFPIDEVGHPHRTQIQRAALLVFGKSRARLAEGNDVIEVPASDGGTAYGIMHLEDGLAEVVARFAVKGQRICIPTLQNYSGAVWAALESGCTIIGADEDKSFIDDVMRELSASMNDSSTVDMDAQ